MHYRRRDFLSGRRVGPGGEARPSHHRRSSIPRRRPRVGDVLQSAVSAVDAHELCGGRARAGNAVPEHRAVEALRLRRLWLQAR